MKILKLSITLLLSIVHSNAQYSKAIEDNSFFIEEAYNQEDRVVQHIVNGSSGSGQQFNELSFTQEWPLFSQTHQISFTIPYFASNNVNGIGDIMLNYRYQLTNENGLAVSPRFSLILPTGDDGQSLGSGAIGMQINIPVSKRWNDALISHFNAGFEWLSETNNSTYFAGASGIFLATSEFNIMTEVLYSSSDGSNEIILSPGVRYAIDIGNLQIVPGLAFPFYFTSGSQNNGIFLYLSFEHPF